MDADILDRRRRRLLAAYAASYLLWTVPLIVTMLHVTDTVPLAGSASWLVPLQLAGFLVWFALMIAVLRLGRRVRSGEPPYAALGDERSSATARRGFLVAFWVVMAAAALVVPLEVWGVALPGGVVALGLIVVGVTAALLGFVVLDGRDAA